MRHLINTSGKAVIAFIAWALVSFAPLANAADLDEIYSPLLNHNQWIYTLGGNYFNLWQKGHHGSASFDSFYLTPHQTSVLNVLGFSPVKGWDVRFGYTVTLPDHFDLLTQNNSDAVTSYQKYTLKGMHEFDLDLRYRHENKEYYLDVNEKRYSSQWNFATSQTTSPSFFNNFQSNFEDIKLGGRFLEAPDGAQPTNFTRALLNEGQWGGEWELGYKNGRLNRDGIFYLADDQHRYYQHRTKPHVLPRVGFRYGLSPALELEGGMTYTSPVKYLYDFKQYKDSGLTNFISGHYSWKNNFKLPVRTRYRPSENIEIIGSLDYHFLEQSFESWEKAENGTVTNYPTKKLLYHNLRPAIELHYVSTAAERALSTPIERITKNLLSKGQAAFSFKLLDDVTGLNKNGVNGAQNLVDPYNVYLYPTENFMAGTEYAALFSGNTALTPGNVSPQNYLELALGARYGLTDNFEVSFRSGYRTSSELHQYSLNDRSDRYFAFKEYYYLYLGTDWNLTANSMLSFNVHFVPDYETLLKASSNPQIFRSHSRYIQAGLTFQKTF